MSTSAPTATTTKTGGHTVTTFQLTLVGGGDVPCVIHLKDGSSVKPAADGSITVSASHLADLAQAGWFPKLT